MGLAAAAAPRPCRPALRGSCVHGPPCPAATPAMPRDGDAGHPARLRWQSVPGVEVASGWLWGRWRGGGEGPRPAPPRLSPSSDTRLERAAGQLRGRSGGVGANPAANLVSELLALRECFSHRAAPTAAPLAYKRGAPVISASSPPCPPSAAASFCSSTVFLCTPGAPNGRDSQQPCRVTLL